MSKPFVDELTLQTYGCFKNATLSLSRLHAFIGPNDSGKTTALHALELMACRAKKPESPVTALIDSANRTSAPLARSSSPSVLRMRVGDAWWSMTSNERDTEDTFGRLDLACRKSSAIRFDDVPYFPTDDGFADLRMAASGAFYFRFDADALREPSPLLTLETPRFWSKKGEGLAGVYDAILARDLRVLTKISEQLGRVFPFVESLALRNDSEKSRALAVRLRDGTIVPNVGLGDGLLYFLAYASLPHLEPVSCILVEEPEKGFHPPQIDEVMRLLRALSEKCQVVLTTRSPLVLKHLEGDEVTVLTRTAEHGTRAVLLKDTPHFDERSKLYELGVL